ncbi:MULTISPECIES: 3-deoxy-D-manno-octulosonic acid transferase [unclassified Psychrobacter]|uniref:3-deoxy-D-manno-octulosonic acid transferase n=1 Tax=unclassified Psychrobacter TaxID=196806 RepID=UPI000A7BAE07|nr:MULTISPECIES: 3-deoxy-D-manno-octulosonic acid transferase [unclassified Psychrobacter]
MPSPSVPPSTESEPSAAQKDFDNDTLDNHTLDNYALSSAAPIKRTTRMPPWYYQLAITLLKPLYRMQVWRRSRSRDNYQQEVAQRFGKQYPPRPVTSDTRNDKTIWCHAVSLGETNTVAPLLDALLAQGYNIWLTNTTQTGHARGASRFAEEIAQGRMSHSYVPVDTPAVIETFLAHVQPVAALFVETELWANILATLSQKDIPSILVNGRLSAASFTRYQKISAVSASMMQNLSLIIAQDSDSAKRFRQLGADSAQIRVAGSLKWVINTPKTTNSKNVTDSRLATDKVEEDGANNKLSNLSDLQFIDRPVWIAASTHSGEESMALALHQQLLDIAELSTTLLIIVPRHPERFDEVAELISETGLQMARRSQDEDITTKTQVYLADSMGELMRWYAQADVALVGGSIVDIGGHNPVEPMSVGTPVLMGQYTQSCQSVVDKLASAGALYQPNNHFYQAIDSDEHLINDSKSDDEMIYQQLQFWLGHLETAKRAGQAGKQMTIQEQAVLPRQLAMIEETIEKFSSVYPQADQPYL